MGALELGSIVVSASLVPSAVVCWLKGRTLVVLAALVLLFPVLWWGAVVLASPDSWWARRFYDEEKLRRATVYSERWARRFAD